MLKCAVNLINLAKTAPESPGVYRFINNIGKVLYVGKAKNIKARLHSHLYNPAYRIKHMLTLAYNITWTMTETEQHALFLEAETIEHLKPPYNIQYKDGKKYYYMHFSHTSIPFPRIYYDFTWKNNAYGPFEKTSDLNVFGLNANHIEKETNNYDKNSHKNSHNFKHAKIGTILSTICKIFKFRTCSDAEFKQRARPCMEYDLGRCSAPCVGYITQKQYQQSIIDFDNFFKDKNGQELLDNTQQQINQAVEEFEFERAQIYHKQFHALLSLKTFVPEQLEIEYADFFIKYKNQIHILGIRQARLKFKVCMIANQEDTLENFIMRWSVQYKLAPDIFTNQALDPSFKLPNHAFHLYKNNKHSINKLLNHLPIKETENEEKLLKLLEKELNITNINKIEIYDNSHMQGKWNVSVGVVWERLYGFKHKEYIVFKHLKNTNDDYQMMKNMFTKRFSTLKPGVFNTNNPLPDLVIIDGGLGQLSVSASLIPVPKFALSKDPNGDKLHSLDGLVDISKPTRLFLMKLRDEAHRFAVQTHSNLRDKLTNQNY